MIRLPRPSSTFILDGLKVTPTFRQWIGMRLVKVGFELAVGRPPTTVQGSVRGGPIRRLTSDKNAAHSPVCTVDGCYGQHPDCAFRDRHDFTVTVTDCTAEQAEQVMAERINHDEDYGFRYQIGWHRR